MAAITLTEYRRRLRQLDDTLMSYAEARNLLSEEYMRRAEERFLKDKYPPFVTDDVKKDNLKRDIMFAIGIREGRIKNIAITKKIAWLMTGKENPFA